MKTLSWAAMEGNEALLKLLLAQADVDVNERLDHGGHRSRVRPRQDTRMWSR